MKSNHFEILRLSETDLPFAAALFRLFGEVFGDEAAIALNEDHVRNLLQNPSFVCFAALYKNEPIAGLTAYELPMYYAECRELFVYDIAVKPECQRMGIGKKLLLAARKYCEQNNINQMFVDASEADAHALDFYRSVQGREERVVQFSFSLDTPR